MKKNLKKVLALLLSMAMILGLAACQSTEQTSSSENSTEKEAGSKSGEEASKADSGEVVSLTFYSDAAVGSFSNGAWLLDYFEKNLGITLEESINTGDGSLMSAFLASGELPDIVIFNGREKTVAAAAGGMLLDLSEYKDQLPNVFEGDLYENYYKPGINFYEDLLGGFYALPTNTGGAENMTYDMQLRWDVYEELGKPEIETYDQLLEVLQDMMELESTNQEGYPVYAIGLWNDWDGNHMENVASYWSETHGYHTDRLTKVVEFPSDCSAAPTSILADDSQYRQGLEWLFKANQMGLIDPESISQTWDDYNAKQNNGQYLQQPWNWFSYGDENSEDYYGFASVWTNDSLQTMEVEKGIGGSCAIGISKNCKNIDKALEFVNWFYSYEGANVLVNGPEGVLWEIKDGKKVPTDLYYENDAVGNAYVFPEGGTRLDGQYAVNQQPIQPADQDPYYDQMVSVFADPDAVGETSVSALDQSWRDAHDGYRSMAEYKMAAGGENIIRNSGIVTLLGTPSDEIMAMANQIGSIVKENSWKMVFAESEAEFEALWEQMQADADALGMDQVVEESVRLFEEACEKAEAYGLK